MEDGCSCTIREREAEGQLAGMAPALVENWIGVWVGRRIWDRKVDDVSMTVKWSSLHHMSSVVNPLDIPGEFFVSHLLRDPE